MTSSSEVYKRRVNFGLGRRIKRRPSISRSFSVASGDALTSESFTRSSELTRVRPRVQYVQRRVWQEVDNHPERHRRSTTTTTPTPINIRSMSIRETVLKTSDHKIVNCLTLDF